MKTKTSRLASLASLALVVLLTACASPGSKAPVEERKPAARPVTPTPAAVTNPAAAETPSAAVKPPPGQENAGKPGYYAVKPGDTLIRIALDNGQNWRDVVRWNGLENPNLIEAGQVLRVVPPSADAAVATTKPIVAAGRVETKPLDGAKPAATGASTAAGTATGSAGAAASASAAAAASAASAASAPSVAVAPPAPREGDEAVDWTWPAVGPVGTAFDENKSKGMAITGKAGDPVFAAADGRVVYAGAGLRGYGNLIIVKHNETYLTAYAHNQALLVKEAQVVRRGQKIAEMGSSDADRVQLHFEIRRQGKPIDPAKLLPAR
jgi:lipoprotein NlpD